MALIFVSIVAATFVSGLGLPDLANRAIQHVSSYRRSPPDNHRTCRCFPGDTCWPTNEEWEAFNQRVGGRLIVTVPIAAACHYDRFTSYDAEVCAALRAVWGYPQTHYETSSSIMSPFFANASCDPFTAPSEQCVTGTYIQYAVNATGLEDYRATLAFATERNIRLVIRNTGHDHSGKSTGAGGLALWTHHLKETQFIPNYSSPLYNGKALKLGAGIQAFEAYAAADAAGVTVVGGDCDTVGIAGGYTQGGGHGPLNTRFGLGSDQALEWEVVTATGNHLVASPTENDDLYWALSGGGGGTYAVVLSVTVRAHEDFKIAAANITFASVGVLDDVLRDVLEAFVMSLPALADAGTWSVWTVGPNYFLLTPIFGPGMNIEELQILLNPTLAALNASGISYSYYINEFDKFLDAFDAMIPDVNVSAYNIGSRLIPRSLVETKDAVNALMDAFKTIIRNDGVISGNHFDVSRFPLHDVKNSINPVWRTAISHVILGLPYDASNFSANLEIQARMTDVLMPALENITPGGGSYINEGDFRQPNWQDVFYGNNYQTLLKIKDKYDPEQLLYGLTAVGSDRWAVQSDGRLCPRTS